MWLTKACYQRIWQRAEKNSEHLDFRSRWIYFIGSLTFRLIYSIVNPSYQITNNYLSIDKFFDIRTARALIFDTIFLVAWKWKQ